MKNVEKKICDDETQKCLNEIADEMYGCDDESHLKTISYGRASCKIDNIKAAMVENIEKVLEKDKSFSNINIINDNGFIVKISNEISNRIYDIDKYIIFGDNHQSADIKKINHIYVDIDSETPYEFNYFDDIPVIINRDIKQMFTESEINVLSKICHEMRIKNVALKYWINKFYLEDKVKLCL